LISYRAGDANVGDDDGEELEEEDQLEGEEEDQPLQEEEDQPLQEGEDQPLQVGEDELLQDDGMRIKRQRCKGPAWELFVKRVSEAPLSFLESGHAPSDK
jgi:hypothetical protein